MDYSKLKYDLSKVDEGQFIIDVFPELGDYKEFSKKGDDVLTRWVILLVDDGSEFFLTHRDFGDRALAVYKTLVAQGQIKIENKLLKQYIDGELSKDHDQYRIDLNAKIYKYFILLDKQSYTAWYSIWSNFQEVNAFLQISIDPLDDNYETKFEKKQKVTSMLPAMQSQLANYEKKIFGDTRIKQIVVNEVAKLTNWPEKMAVKHPEYANG